jgi:hypothetical protein
MAIIFERGATMQRDDKKRRRAAWSWSLVVAAALAGLALGALMLYQLSDGERPARTGPAGAAGDRVRSPSNTRAPRLPEGSSLSESGPESEPPPPSVPVPVPKTLAPWEVTRENTPPPPPGYTPAWELYSPPPDPNRPSPPPPGEPPKFEVSRPPS